MVLEDKSMPTPQRITRLSNEDIRGVFKNLNLDSEAKRKELTQWRDVPQQESHEAELQLRVSDNTKTDNRKYIHA